MPMRISRLKAQKQQKLNWSCVAPFYLLVTSQNLRHRQVFYQVACRNKLIPNFMFFFQPLSPISPEMEQ